MTSLREAPASKAGLVADRLSDFPTRPYKRRRRIFYSLLSIEEDGAGARPSRPLIAPAGRITTLGTIAGMGGLPGFSEMPL